MKTRILIIIAVIVMFVNELIMAQGLPGLPEAPNQAPIDGGLTLLAAAGGGYAIKKLRDKRKREQEDL